MTMSGPSNHAKRIRIVLAAIACIAVAAIACVLLWPRHFKPVAEAAVFSREIEASTRGPVGPFGEIPEGAAASINDLSLENSTLQSSIQRIAGYSKATIVVRWNALRGVGITPSDMVRVHIWETTVMHALSMLCDYVGNDRICLALLPNEIAITSPADRDRLVGSAYSIATYNIDDIIPPQRKADLKHDNVEDDLSRVLEDSVAPDSWTDNGGYQGSIRTIDNVLVIRQTPENQAKVRQLLTQIRQSGVPPSGPRHSP